MEHPVDTTFVPPLVDERLVASIERAVAAAGAHDHAALRDAWAYAHGLLLRVQALAELARYAALGQVAAVERLRDELECLSVDELGADHHDHAAHPAVDVHGALPPRDERVNFAAVIDLLCGASLVTIGEPARRLRYLDALTRLIEAALRYPLAAEDDPAALPAPLRHATTAALLQRLASGDLACAPRLPAAIEARLRILVHRWGHGDPVSGLIELVVMPSRALAVSAARVAPGETVTITCTAATSDAARTVMFAPHQPAETAVVAPDQLRAVVPGGARSGPVVIATRPTEEAYLAARASDAHVTAGFGDERGMSILGLVPLERWGYLPAVPGAPTVAIDAPTPLAVTVGDGAGRRLEPAIVSRGEIVTLRYRAPGAVVAARVDAPAGTVVEHRAGRVVYRPERTGPIVLRDGDRAATIDVTVIPRWRVESTRLRVPIDGRAASFAIELEAPVDHAVTWSITSRQGAVQVAPTATIAAGATRVEVAVTIGGRPAGFIDAAILDRLDVGLGGRVHTLGCDLDCPFGAWAAPIESALAIVGVHAVVLHTGKVLFFSFDRRAVNNSSGFSQYFADPNAGSYQLWDPVTETADPVRSSGRNLFCAGQAQLGDGTIFVAGGQDGAGAADATGKYDDLFSAWLGGNDGSHKDIHTYDPVADQWLRWPDMRDGRYYPTVQTLADGSAFVAAGLSNLQQFILSGSVWAQNDHYEIYPAGAFGLGAAVDAKFASVDQYPIIRLLPGTRHLFVHKHRTTTLFDLDSKSFVAGASFLPPAPVGRQTYPMQTGYVVLPQREGDPPRILIVGGSTAKDFDYNTQSDKPAIAGAFIFDYDPAAPTKSQWRATLGAPLQARILGDTVLLPDGQVFVVSGVAMGASAGHSSSFVLEAELFDPVTETFTSAGSLDHAHPRGYHATAVLLPDGRVAVAGSTKAYNNPDPGGVTPVDDTSIQVFSPPYLFRGPRPMLTDVPTAAAYGATIAVQGDPTTPIVTMMLMRPCAVTHSQDMDQRAIRLDPTPLRRGGRARLEVRLPADRSLAPPGYYMLFGLSADGVPSLASWIRLGEVAGAIGDGGDAGAPPPAELPPPVHLGKYTEHANIVSTFDGDIIIEKIDQHCNVTLESKFGSITVLEKIDQHCFVTLKAATSINIGQKIDQHCTVNLIAGGSVTIGQKIDQHCDVKVGSGATVSIGQKIDGNSTVDVDAVGVIFIGQKIDGGSKVVLRSGGVIVILEKVGGGAELAWDGLALMCPDTAGATITAL